MKQKKEENQRLIYTVSQDKKSGLWYVHQKHFPYIPCAGTFCEKRSEALEYAKMYNGLPHKVGKIEEKRRREGNG